MCVLADSYAWDSVAPGIIAKENFVDGLFLFFFDDVAGGHELDCPFRVESRH